MGALGEPGCGTARRSRLCWARRRRSVGSREGGAAEKSPPCRPRPLARADVSDVATSRVTIVTFGVMEAIVGKRGTPIIASAGGRNFKSAEMLRPCRRDDLVPRDRLAALSDDRLHLQVLPAVTRPERCDPRKPINVRQKMESLSVRSSSCSTAGFASDAGPTGGGHLACRCRKSGDRKPP
jgi:hypothetical protein